MWAENIYFFNNRNEKLFGVLEYPEDEKPQHAFLIFCPHPILGGDMDNNIIRAICETVRQTPSMLLRFDYHGCGESEIHIPKEKHVIDYYQELEDTQNTLPFYDDTIVAINYMKNALHSWKVQLSIIGYSFGGYLALRYFGNAYPIFAIAPPFGKNEVISTKIKNAHCLLAENDFLGAEHVPHNLHCETASGADHFFRGKEYLVKDWLLSKLFQKEFI